MSSSKPSQTNRRRSHTPGCDVSSSVVLSSSSSRNPLLHYNVCTRRYALDITSAVTATLGGGADGLLPNAAASSSHPNHPLALGALSPSCASAEAPIAPLTLAAFDVVPLGGDGSSSLTGAFGTSSSSPAMRYKKAMAAYTASSRQPQQKAPSSHLSAVSDNNTINATNNSDAGGDVPPMVRDKAANTKGGHPTLGSKQRPIVNLSPSKGSPLPSPPSSSAFIIIDNIPSIVLLSEVLRHIEPFLDHVLHAKCIVPFYDDDDADAEETEGAAAAVGGGGRYGDVLAGHHYAVTPTYSLLLEVCDFSSAADGGSFSRQNNASNSSHQSSCSATATASPSPSPSPPPSSSSPSPHSPATAAGLPAVPPSAFSMDAYIDSVVEECDGHALTALFPEVTMRVSRVLSTDVTVVHTRSGIHSVNGSGGGRAVVVEGRCDDHGTGGPHNGDGDCDCDGGYGHASMSASVVVPLSLIVSAPPPAAEGGGEDEDEAEQRMHPASAAAASSGSFALPSSSLPHHCHSTSRGSSATATPHQRPSGVSGQRRDISPLLSSTSFLPPPRLAAPPPSQQQEKKRSGGDDGSDGAPLPIATHSSSRRLQSSSSTIITTTSPLINSSPSPFAATSTSSAHAHTHNHHHHHQHVPTCSICLEAMGTVPCVTTLCSHQFHIHCFAKVGPSCPLCRFDLSTLSVMGRGSRRRAGHGGLRPHQHRGPNGQSAFRGLFDGVAVTGATGMVGGGGEEDDSYAYGGRSARNDDTRRRRSVADSSFSVSGAPSALLPSVRGMGGRGAHCAMCVAGLVTRGDAGRRSAADSVTEMGADAAAPLPIAGHRRQRTGGSDGCDDESSVMDSISHMPSVCAPTGDRGGEQQEEVDGNTTTAIGAERKGSTPLAVDNVAATDGGARRNVTAPPPNAAAAAATSTSAAPTTAMWMCLVCGVTHGGSSSCGHADAHYAMTGHRFAIDVYAPRVWDFGSGAYVHRLVQQLHHHASSSSSSSSLAGRGGVVGGGGPSSSEGPPPPIKTVPMVDTVATVPTAGAEGGAGPSSSIATTNNGRNSQQPLLAATQADNNTNGDGDAKVKAHSVYAHFADGAAGYNAIWDDYDFYEDDDEDAVEGVGGGGAASSTSKKKAAKDKAQLMGSVDFIAEFYARLLEDQLGAQEGHYARSLARLKGDIAAAHLQAEEQKGRRAIHAAMVAELLQVAGDTASEGGVCSDVAVPGGRGGGGGGGPHTHHYSIVGLAQHITRLLAEATAANRAKAKAVLKDGATPSNANAGGKTPAAPSAAAARRGGAAKEPSCDDAGLETNQITLAAAKANLATIRSLKAQQVLAPGKVLAHNRAVAAKDKEIAALNARLEALYAQL